MTRRTTKTALSDEAKIAKVQQMAANPRFHLNAEHVNKLIEKYGPYAYDIIQQARQEPYNLMPRVGGKGCPTSKAIAYFATTDIPAETLATGLKIRTAEAKEKLATTLAGLSQDGSAQPEPTAQNRLAARADERMGSSHDGTAQARLEVRVDERMADGHDGAAVLDAPVQANNGQQQPIAKPTQPLLNTPVSLTLDAYAAHYEEGKGPLTGRALLDAAYDDFSNSEGFSKKLYVERPNYGHPTVGVGGLVVPRDLCAKSLRKTKKRGESVSPYDQVYGVPGGWKDRFQKMELTDANGRKLTKTEKGQIFEDLRTAVRNNTLRTRDENGYNVIVSPASASKVRSTSATLRKQFDANFKVMKDKACKALGHGNKAQGEEIFDKYPCDLQLALVHTYFAGRPGNKLTDDINAGRVDPQDPMAMVDEIKRLRSSKSEGNKNSMNRASEAEMKTREEARDSLIYAQNQIYRQIPRVIKVSRASINMPTDEKPTLRLADLHINVR